LENYPINFARNQTTNYFSRSSKSGNDGNLLEMKEEELWVGSGYVSNEEETKGRNDFMNNIDVQLPSCFNPYNFHKKRKKNLLGKKGQFQLSWILNPKLQCIGLSSWLLKLHSKLAPPYLSKL
jgi:hypothetical protein